MYPKANVDILKIPGLIEKYKKAMRFTPADAPYFTIRFKKMTAPEILKCEKIVIKDLKALIQK